MPFYEFRCSQHGLRTIQRPMAEAGDPARCACGAPMRRVYSGQAFVIRPSGWHLRPGDRGYSDFRREAELGELRGPSAERNRYIDPALTHRETPAITYTDAQMRNLRQLSELVDRGVRESSDIPEFIRED